MKNNYDYQVRVFKEELEHFRYTGVLLSIKETNHLLDILGVLTDVVEGLEKKIEKLEPGKEKYWIIQKVRK